LYEIGYLLENDILSQDKEINYCLGYLLENDILSQDKEINYCLGYYDISLK